MLGPTVMKKNERAPMSKEGTEKDRNAAIYQIVTTIEISTFNLGNLSKICRLYVHNFESPIIILIALTKFII